MENQIALLHEKIIPWLFSGGVKIALILAAFFVFYFLEGKFIRKIITKVIRPEKFESPEAEKKREDTLIKILNGVIKAVILVIAAMMVLDELGIDTKPIIAGAGVVGVAFGFGGQYLIRDLISGIFIFLENQYRIGDVITVSEVTGVVEDVNLRVTVLRDLDGTLYHIPNGEIKQTANLSKDYARINLDIGVSYSAKLDKVIRVVNKVGEEMKKEKKWEKILVEAPQFLRVDKFDESAIILKILGKTKPMEQWDATGELRKRIKIAFDEEGIEIPFPQVVVHQPQPKKQKIR